MLSSVSFVILFVSIHLIAHACAVKVRFRPDIFRAETSFYDALNDAKLYYAPPFHLKDRSGIDSALAKLGASFAAMSSSFRPAADMLACDHTFWDKKIGDIKPECTKQFEELTKHIAKVIVEEYGKDMRTEQNKDVSKYAETYERTVAVQEVVVAAIPILPPMTPGQFSIAFLVCSVLLLVVLLVSIIALAKCCCCSRRNSKTTV